jgi:transposase
MFISVIPVKSKNKRLMVVKESYRDEITKKPKQRKIRDIGYIEDFLDRYEDPLQHFRDELKAEQNNMKTIQPSKSIGIDPNAKLSVRDLNAPRTDRKSLGSAVLSYIYHELEIDSFMNNKRRYTKAEYNHNAIFKLLVYSRILFPSSKRESYFNKGWFFEKMDFTLTNIYRAMDDFIDWKDDLLVHLNKKITENYGRDTTLLYYDVTNYYFEIDHQDENKRKGVSKEHRPNPIVQMGLFMDDNGLPVNYKLFPGNTNDCKTLIPMMGETRLDLDIRDIIVVGDKGMMSGENISRILSQKNGYVISYSVRGASQEYQDYVLNQDGYSFIDMPIKQRYENLSKNSRSSYKLKAKTQMVPREIAVPDIRTGKKTKVMINERHIVFYSEKYAKKAKADREAALLKAFNTVENNKAIPKSFGCYKYVKEEYLQKDGELIKPSSSQLFFDEQKLKKEEALDGYYVIFTNVIGLEDGEEPFNTKSKFTKDGYFKLNKTVRTQEIIEMYRGLWEIEETFKITKSTLEVRPVFHRNWNRIESHFLTCFVSLVVIRLLETNLDSKWSTESIIKSIKAANGSLISGNLYNFNYVDEILLEIQEKFGITLDRQFLTIGEIKKIMAKTKKKQ